jgi:hypothetical protein
LVCKFLRELKDILHSIYVLQSSIELYSHLHSLTKLVVRCGVIGSGGAKLITLYYSMTGEVIAWSSFTNMSTSRAVMIERFIKDEDSISFNVLLHRRDIPVWLHCYSEFADE